MFDTTRLEHHHGHNNNGGATNRILFPLNLLSLPELICSHTGPVSAAQTHSRSPTIIMMCPMPPIHGTALLMHCCVSYTHTHTDTFNTTYIQRNHICTYKDTHTHNHKNPVKHTQPVSTQAYTHPNAATHFTCQS